MLIIAFGHEKRVGKDSAAKFLCSHLRVNKKGLDIIYAGFSDKLKDICFQLYGWAGLMPGDYYELPENEHKREIVLPRIGKSPRQIWIEVANKLREVHPGTWLDYLCYTLECDICFVKDLRYPDEAKRIIAMGGLIYKINRPSVPHTSDKADDALLGFTAWSGIIENDSDLKSFHDKIINQIAPEVLEKLEGI